MVASLTRDKELYGVRVDPLQLGPILGTNLQLSYALLGYQVTSSKSLFRRTQSSEILVFVLHLSRIFIEIARFYVFFNFLMEEIEDCNQSTFTPCMHVAQHTF
jgi:hypothetical protein